MLHLLKQQWRSEAHSRQAILNNVAEFVCMVGALWVLHRHRDNASTQTADECLEEFHTSLVHLGGEVHEKNE